MVASKEGSALHASKAKTPVRYVRPSGRQDNLLTYGTTIEIAKSVRGLLLCAYNWRFV